jgi:hypothetical protein
MSLIDLPLQLISYLGEFLELKEIRALSLTNKKIYQKIQKEKIFFHYIKKNFEIQTLPEKVKGWKEFAKILIVKWEKYSMIFKISEDKKRIETEGGKWGCAITNLSFSKGRHLITFFVEKYSLGFLGIASKTTPLETPCFGRECFAFSPYYKSYR